MFAPRDADWAGRIWPGLANPAPFSRSNRCGRSGCTALAGASTAKRRASSGKFSYRSTGFCSGWSRRSIAISLPESATIGKGLRIWHFGGIFINGSAVIGNNCTLRQGVTIGNRHKGGPSPVLGDNVELGAYAQILGDVRIGNNCRIGAMSVVLTDVPDGAAVGQPARIIPPGTVTFLFT